MARNPAFGRSPRTLVGVALTGLVAAAGLTGAATAAAAPAPRPTGAIVLVHLSSPTNGFRADVARAGAGAVRRELPGGRRGDRVVSVRLPAGDTAVELARLAALPGVTAVEPPVRRRLTGGYTPDDPDYAKQSSYLAAVDAPAAWGRQRGSAAITVAVVDSGVDVTHPDLKNKIDGTFNAIDPKSTSVADVMGHGTFVAGVAAADSDNGTGIAGAGFDTHLLAVKVAGDEDDIAIDDEVVGIRWAADHHADVINLSLSGTDYSRTEAAAVAYAERKGSLVVAAAGNDANTTVQYPAAYPGVIAVGATDPGTHRRASFSSYGPWVTLAAPGVGIESTTPVHGGQLFRTAPYAVGDGTSFATPLVAGEAALLKAQNPTLSVGRLRSAVVASAAGYRGQGLGAGSVDFARGLDHVAPTTTPTGVSTNGTQDVVTLSAASTAPAVAFRLDHGTFGRPVPVHGGSASTALPTFGYADGPHTVSAVDCTAYGECGSGVASASLTLASDPPSVTSPASGASVTGLLDVTADRPAGGGVRLLVDGHPTGFRARAPYTFPVTASAWRDGSHTIAVQLCSTDGTRCDGPRSVTTSITSTALHPRLDAVSPAAFSPNGDGVRDAATVRFTLPSRQTVQAEVRTPDGTLLGDAALGTLPAGTHSWTWRGSVAGRRVPDGRYLLAIATAQGTVRGWVSAPAVVDTVAPTVRTGTGGRTTFYPYPDGYRDRFRTTTVLGGPGVLTLTVRNARGRIVRTESGPRAAGATYATWNGKDAAGHRVPAGHYRFSLTVTDAAGNSRTTAVHTIAVSARRLRRVTVSVIVSAHRAVGTGSSADCAGASAKHSRYALGLLFSNACTIDDYDVALARYVLRVPTALSYKAVAIGVSGQAGVHGAQLTASIQRNDGVLEVPAYLTVHAGRTAWHTIATVSGRDHVDASRHVTLTLVLTSAGAGKNAFDARAVRLRVATIQLR